MNATAKVAPRVEPMPTAPASSAGPKSDALVLRSGEGVTTTVSEHVVAKIAGLAVREVEGVHSLVPFGTGQSITNIVDSLRGSESRDLGVHVEVGKVEAAVDVRVITNYGANIPGIAEAIRKSVKSRIETMTGLQLKELNIEVVDLNFEDDMRTQKPEPRVQ